MSVEFISLTYPNRSTELKPIPGAQLDRQYLIRYAREVEAAGFDYTLQPYGSSSFDPFVTAATIVQHTEKLKTIVALRPNNIHPTYAAKSLATLDQVSGGRAVLHVIAGGDDHEQQREGDYATKPERYARADEYIRVLRRAWQNDEPFSWDEQYYRFSDYHNAVRPVAGSIPVSLGGSSNDAYRVGGALADIFGLWGESLAGTQEQIERITSQARAVGRTDRPRIWVTFRPIIAPTKELAWQKAETIARALERNQTGDGASVQPQNEGSRRLLAEARQSEIVDKVLWTKPAAITHARGASTALVGTPEQVAEALLEYVKLGAELISIRGYDNLNDVIDYGRYLLPLVREETAKTSGEPSTGAPTLASESNEKEERS